MTGVSVPLPGFPSDSLAPLAIAVDPATREPIVALQVANGSMLVRIHLAGQQVLGESLLIALIGGGLGLGAAWLIVQRGDPTGGLLPIFVLPARDVAVGVALVAGLGIVAGLLPAVSAMQLKITDALRRV